MSPFEPAMRRAGSDSLADVLERVLDKGLVVAGDIQINLLDIELLTIKIRLLVSSADKAEELGMAWWRNDPFFTGLPAGDGTGDGTIERRLDRIEDALAALAGPVADRDAVEERQVAATHPTSGP